MRYILFVILLTIGVKAPWGLPFSSLSNLLCALFVLVIAAYGVHSNKIFGRPGLPKYFVYNSIFSSIVIVYTLVGWWFDKLDYPQYILNILVYQYLFMIIVRQLNEKDYKWVFTKIVAINFGIVLIQLIGGLVNYPPLYEMRFLGLLRERVTEFIGPFPRAAGLAVEPAHLMHILLPIVVSSIFSESKSGQWASRQTRAFSAFLFFVINSLVSYIQLSMIITIKTILSLTIKSIYRTFTLLVLAFTIANSVPIIKSRINSVTTYFATNEVNSSSISGVVSNINVMLGVLSRNPLTGEGLTSHRKNYDDMYKDTLDAASKLTLQREDASSLLVLLLSETGLIGFLTYYWFIISSIFLFYKHRDSCALGLTFSISQLALGIRYGHLADPLFMLFLQISFWERSKLHRARKV